MSKEDNKNLKNGGEKMLEAMNNIDDKYLAEYDKSVKEGFVIGEKEGLFLLIDGKTAISGNTSLSDIYEKYADAYYQFDMKNDKIDNYVIQLFLDIVIMHYRASYVEKFT